MKGLGEGMWQMKGVKKNKDKNNERIIKREKISKRKQGNLEGWVTERRDKLREGNFVFK